jgi:hypothetical protein
MLRCAIDVRRWSISLALFGFWNNEPSTRLEARLLHTRSTDRVLEQLEHWTCWYHLENDPDKVVVIGCRADRWPVDLAGRLQEAGYALQWIDAARPLKEGVHLLRSLQESSVFLRATVMAHWPSVCERKGSDATILEAHYRYLRNRLMDLEIDMFVHGCCPCPGHVMPTCPDCDFPPDVETADLPWPVNDEGRIEAAQRIFPAEL